MVNLAQAAGHNVSTIYIPFQHQEADSGESRSTYLSWWQGFKADAEAQLAALGIPVVWLVDQAAGTHNNGAWPVRMAIYDAALPENGGSNVIMTQPRYWLPLGVRSDGTGYDGVHHSYAARVLQGEVIAEAIAAHRAGKPWHCAWPSAVTAAGNDAVIDFDSLDPLHLDPLAATPRRSDFGFTASGATIQSVRQTGDRQVTVTMDTDAAGKTLRYAYRSRDSLDYSPAAVAATGNLREAWQMPSRLIPGSTLYRYALAFELTI